jgi:diaminohydroxyphosphoribosylaminopyrimidine deaminase/5-amino-6-(5-phosphoribosylamino)uracil reductase
MLALLADRGINELHIEAGEKLNGSLLREGCVDELLLYLAPTLLGDTARAMASLPTYSQLPAPMQWRFHAIDRVGDDVRLLARALKES